MSKPNISYNHAHITLGANESQSLFGEEYKKEFQNGQLNNAQGVLRLLLVNDCVLEMHGIKIPIFGMRELSSEGAIIDSVKRLLGDFGNGLERSVELAEKRIIQDDFYFTPKGLCDYSRADELERKQVTEWVKYARDYPSNVNELLPDDLRFPKGLEVKFAPTFQALRNLGDYAWKEGNSDYIGGETFADCVKNFLDMYDAVVAHIDWEERTGNEIRFRQLEKGEHTHTGVISVAELVLTK